MTVETAKIRLLGEILGSHYKSSNEEYLYFCAFCDYRKKRKLSINFKKNKFKCWICNTSGNIKYIVSRFGTDKQIQCWKETTNDFDMSQKKDLLSLLKGTCEDEEEKISLPSEFRTLVSNETDILSVPVKRYLYERGLSKKDIFYWKIGFCLRGEYANRLIVPSFNVDGSVNYFVTRSYIDDWPKYKNPKKNKKDFIFNELYIDFRKPLVLTEGVFDAMNAGYNSIPLLGSSLSKKSKLFFEIVKNNSIIYLALDLDAFKKELKIAETLLEYDIDVRKVVVAPYDDVGEMKRELFEKRKCEAVKLNKQVLLTYRLMKEKI